MSRVLFCRKRLWCPGTTAATWIFCGGQTFRISKRVCPSRRISQTCSCSQTSQTPVGVPLSETPISPARGLSYAPDFLSTTGSFWRFCLRSEGFFLLCVVVWWRCSPTTPRPWRTSRNRVALALPLSMRWLCEASHIQLLPQFIPGWLNVLADSQNRKSKVIGSEWTLCSEAFSQLLRQWPANIDLFATALNHRLPVYFSPMVDPQSAGMDAILQSWDGLQAYAFPPLGLISRVLAKVRQSRGLELTLVAPFWPQHPWFPDLLELLVEVPFFLPRRRDLLKQPHLHHYHQNLPVLQLTAWHISSDLCDIPVSLRRWLVSLPSAVDVPRD